MVLQYLRKCGIFFLGLTALAVALMGQTTPTTVQLSASETRFVIVPAHVANTRVAFTLEGSTGQNSFLVSSSDPASVITLIAADGTEITPQTAAQHGYSFDVQPANSVVGPLIDSTPFPALLSVYITLPRGVIGSAELKINNSGVVRDSALLVVYYPVSSIRVGLTPNKAVFVSGETAALSLLVFDGSLPVNAADGLLRVQSSSDPNGSVYSTTCNDSGPLDAVPGDGIFTCTIDGLTEGTYVASAKVTMPGGTVRNASSSFRLIPSYGSIVSSTDEGLDQNHNGLLEGIRLNLSLDAAVAGDYRLIVRLLASNGKEIQQAWNGTLTAGPRVLSIDFPARLISALSVNGEYTIANATLLFESAEADDIAATRLDLGMTKAYLLSQLELGARAPIVGDLNADGLVDCTDVGIVRSSFGKKAGQTGFNAKADANRDGVVDVRDLAIVSRQMSADTHCGN